MSPSSAAMPQTAARDPCLDVVKGLLVLAMVLYHAMNHFGDLPERYYGYLRFVNGSFVFISGYVATAFHADPVRGSAFAPVRRLGSRGLKLLTLFTALNLAASCAEMSNYRNVTFGLAGWLDNAGAIFISGRSPQVAFRILVPISYVLMLSGLFLVSTRLRPALLAVALGAALSWNFLAELTPNAFFVLTGLVGLAFGLLHGQAIGRHRLRSWPVVAAGFVVLASLMNTLSGNALAYGIGVALLLKLLYDAASVLHPGTRTHAWLVRLGRYSLVGYIAQIGFLFTLDRVMRGRGLAPAAELALGAVTTGAFVLACGLAIDHLRRRSRLVDGTYRLVFA